MTFEEHCRNLISNYEGYRKHAYQDSLGILTIGIGFNLENPGARNRIQALGVDFAALCSGKIDLTDTQVQKLFQQDLKTAMTRAGKAVTNFDALADPRKFVVIDMIFNLGLAGFEGFYGTIAAVEKDDFSGAAAHMLNSLWHSQVGRRAEQDAAMMRSGQWPAESTLSAQALSADQPDITPSNYCVLRDGRFADTSASQMQQSFHRDYPQSGAKRIALFFHGGLVDKQSGLGTAGNLLAPYTSADTFPYFIVWESGIFDVLALSLPQIIQETIFNRVTTLVSSFLQQHSGQGAGAFFSQALGGQSEQELARSSAANTSEAALSQAPLPSESELLAFAQSVEADPVVRAQIDLIGSSETPPETFRAQSAGSDGTLIIRSSPWTLMSPAVVNAIRAQKSGEQTMESFALTLPGLNPFAFGWAVAKIAYAIISRFINKSDHGMPCTLTEEILRALYIANAGAAVWGSMKRYTEDAFALPDGGGSMLLQVLKDLWNANTKVTLIGHSAGTIYACNFLKAADATLPPEATFDVVFMAPAVTLDLFQDTITRYAARINDFRQFAMHDELECQDAILGPVYPRSLLYFVSGVCENGVDVPLLGMERFKDRSPVVAQFTLQRSFYSKTPSVPQNDGKETESIHHGGFPGDDATKASTQYLLKNGI